jgi:PhzF family phenazine biosynthesis protein
VEFDDGAATTDADRRLLPARTGASHAAFVARAPRPDGGIAVRFFTAAGELPGCGHGTVAAQAVLFDTGGFTGRQYTGGRTFEVRAARRPEGIEVYFDQGIVTLRPPTAEERGVTVRGGIRPAGDVTVATPGAPRLLIPVADRDALRATAPDLDALGAATRRLGLLGCFVYTASTVDGSMAARMFAPAIGVPEDVANANSTGCLAAHLLVTAGTTRIEVEQGDSLGRPATVYATAEATGDGIRTWVGGLAVIR